MNSKRPSKRSERAKKGRGANLEPAAWPWILGSHRGPHHPAAYPLAILSSLIDPDGVRQAVATRTRPEKALFAAMHLIDSIDDWLKGPSKSYYSQAELEQVTRLYSGLADQTWHLLNDDRFSLKEAVDQPWCKHKTEHNLLDLLVRTGYPFNKFFELNGIELYITKQAYEVALAKDRERGQKLDRERKRKGAKEKKSKIATGTKTAKTGTKRPTSGTNGRTSGKFRPTSVAT